MFPSNFLTDLACKYELSPEQEKVFLLWWGNGKDNREISEQLHVTAEAIRNRKTGIYKKFSITGTGANKANKLRNWLESEAKKQNVKADIQPNDDLDLLVQEVKRKIAADVTERCGTMRVLDMTQPVDLDRIYTNVNILKNLTRLRRYDDDVMKDYNNREHFERFLVGEIQERVEGFAVVEEFQKLVVLGKPGAGKTTFMKYLAMSCLGGRFYGELVPMFVTLKAYAEERGQPSLESYILTEFEKRKVSQDIVKRLLDEGKALILLDGLDEVKKEDDRRVKQDIDQFSIDWLKNRVAITCRIAAREYQFEKFTEVEVADFDDSQIEIFVNNWFRERDESQAERLLERLKDNKPVKELAKSPLLLTLSCLVFDKTNSLPEKQYKLFEEGLDVLLKIWDEKRYIERDFPKHFKGEQIYRNLSSEDKADMIGKIAFNSFVNGEYFFRQEDLQHQIKEYICKLTEASADPDVLRWDSAAMLKAIEHHHGLLVERARKIYSFSHLTFQEYFTAREIERERNFEKLIENISDPRWKEVFYLTAEMLRRSDDLVKIMKERIDGMLGDNGNLQVFLEWLKKKTDSVQTNYKITGMRAYYTYLGLHSFVHYLERNPQVRRTRSRAHAHFLSLKEVLQVSRDLAFAIDSKLSHDINFDSISIIENDLILDRDLSRNLVRNYDVEIAHSLKLNVLVNVLQKLKDKALPAENIDSHLISQYWKSNGEEWNQELHQICIDRRNIGHDWQFTKEQGDLLKKYYAANLLLVECMNRSNVSEQVREEIESTMLLPSKK